MQFPSDYRKAAYRSAIYNELAKIVMKRLTANDSEPLMTPKLLMRDAAVPEAAFHDVLVELLGAKSDAERVMERYEIVEVDENGNVNPEPGPARRGARRHARAR